MQSPPDLKRWMSDDPVSCRRERFWARGFRFVRRHSQGVVVVVAAFVVLFVLAIGTSAYSEIRHQAEVDSERLRTEAARGTAKGGRTRVVVEVAVDKPPARAKGGLATGGRKDSNRSRGDG